MEPTTLFIVDDHPVLREGIRMLVESTGAAHVVGSSATASGALSPLRRLHPELVLLDLDLGEEDGLAWLPRLIEAAPGAKVLILTALRDRTRDEEALRAGARGLLLKDAPPEVLVGAIRSVAAGALWFDPAALAARGGAPAVAVDAPLSELTDREREGVALVAEGLRNEEVGRRLGISEKTVRNHLTGVFQKLRLSGRMELVLFAVRHGVGRRPPV